MSSPERTYNLRAKRAKLTVSDTAEMPVKRGGGRGGKTPAKKSKHDVAEEAAVEPTEVQGILSHAFNVKATTDEEIGESCVAMLLEEASQATVDRTTEPIRWGNTKGLFTLERLDELLRRVAVLEHKNAAQEQINKALEHAREVQVKTNEVQMKTNEDQAITNEDLKKSNQKIQEELWKMTTDAHFAKTYANWFFDLRNRFISTYKRDILGTADAHDHKMISRGNALAHSGDAEHDALLYKDRRRHDRDVYLQLYGIDWETVWRKGECHSNSDPL